MRPVVEGDLTSGDRILRGDAPVPRALKNERAATPTSAFANNAIILAQAATAGVAKRELRRKECDRGVCFLVYREGPGTFGMYVTNSTHEDVDLTLELQLENMESSEETPLSMIVGPRTTDEKHLLNVEIVDKKEKFNLDPRFKFFFGNPSATPDGTLYSLPYPKGKHEVTQGFDGQGAQKQGATHTGNDRHAVDFAMPNGTVVSAARSGVVVEVVQKFTEGALDNGLKDKANLVRVRHSDGTYSEYAHLQKNGAKVKVGDNVAEGQTLALSDNTGFTSAPHLHFAVVKADRKVVGGKRGFVTVPWKFKDAAGKPFVPQAGQVYENK